MLLLVRLFGSKAIIHNSPLQNPAAPLRATKATENMEHNLMDYLFFPSWHNDTITLKLIFQAGEEDRVTGKIRWILCSLVFKFDKLTGCRQTFPSPLCHALRRGGCNTVAAGHRCRADELSDNNRVKRGNKWCHGLTDWNETIYFPK